MDNKELKKQLEKSSSTKSKFIVLFHYLMKEKKNGSYEYVSNEDVGQLYEKLCQYEEKVSDKDKKFSEKSYHDSLKDAKKALRQALENEYGKGNGLQKKGSAIAYYEGKDNGLELYMAGSKRKWQKDFLAILAKSKDILPSGWQDMFLDHLCEPEDHPQHKIIDFGSNLRLFNMHWIPQIYDSIINKNVIKLKFNYEYKEVIDVLVAPMHLKRYNDRWYVAGLELDDNGHVKKYDAWAFDRIESVKMDDLKCPEQSSSKYDDYFDNIVGIRKPAGREVEEIYIRTTTAKAHQLINTKAIHESQVENSKFDNEKGEGEFIIKVIPNKELQTRLLSYGDDIYIPGDGVLQRELKATILRMADRYKLK